jgi:hypothetical protein
VCAPTGDAQIGAGVSDALLDLPRPTGRIATQQWKAHRAIKSIEQGPIRNVAPLHFAALPLHLDRGLLEIDELDRVAAFGMAVGSGLLVWGIVSAATCEPAPFDSPAGTIGAGAGTLVGSITLLVISFLGRGPRPG